MRLAPVLSLLAAAWPLAALANYTVEMNAIDIKGVGEPIGKVTITAGAQGGVTITPDLRKLPPGPHGFHVHEFGNCGAREKDGKLTPGDMAGGHWDPDKAGKHEGPSGKGHRGDLPPLEVAGDGTAKKAVSSARIKLEDLKNKALVIHAGGDNFKDEPKPLGGGGDRIACGVIQAGVKR